MEINQISLLFIGTALISFILSIYAGTRKLKPVSTLLAILLLSVSIWTLFYGLELSSETLKSMELFLTFEYIGITAIPVMWLLFAAHYTGSDAKLTISKRIFIFIIPVVTLFLVATNKSHHLFYSTTELGNYNGFLFHKFVAGPFYWIHIIYSNLIIIIGVILIIRMYFQVSKDNRSRIGIILLSVMLPYLISLIYILGFRPFGFLDLTPVGFLSMGILLMFGALGNKLLDIKPLALSTLFDSIPDAIFVIDANSKLISTNPSARNLIGSENHKINDILKQLSNNTIINTKAPITKSIEINNMIFQVNSNTINDKQGKLLGTIYILTDVTEQKQIENALRESEEQFKQLAEIFPEIIFEVDLTGKITYVNDQGLEKFNIKKEQLEKGLNMFSYVDDKDKLRVQERLTERKQGKVGGFLEFTAKITEGQFFDALAYTAIINKNNVNTGIRGFILDISERKKMERLQELLMNIAETYINTPLDSLDNTINTSLKEMGEFVHADRSYIFDYDWDENICINTYEWCAGGINPEINNLKDVPMSMLTGWIEAHTHNKPMSIEDVQSLAKDSTVREVLEPQGIKSLITIPLIDNENCMGFVGFDSVFLQYSYSENEMKLLQVFAQMLVNIRNRKAAHELINEQIRAQKLTADISSDFVSANSNNLDSKINMMLKNLGSYFNVDRTYLLRYSEDGWFESNTNEWCAEGINSEKDTLKNVDLNIYPWWKKHVDLKEMINVPDVDLLPEEAIAERIEFQRQNIKSLICVPVVNNNRVKGFLGLDSVKLKRVWNDNQIDIIKLLVNILGDAIIKVNNENELIKSIELAEAASIAKSDFLSNMSHEIRTPLNGVIGFTDLLRNTTLNKTQNEYLDNAIFSANSLLDVISDILDFSKIEAGKLDLEFIKTDIVELVESASDIIKAHASKKGLELLLNIQPDLPRFATIDALRLKQIIVNLLSNAIKFTQSGEVELSVNFKKIDNTLGNFTIEVRDTGIGIKESDKDKLFKAFSQADTSTTRRYGGTGLGLIISNSLAKKMDSRIKFKSEFGKGSTFTLSIETMYEYGEANKKYSLSKIKNVLVIDDNANNRLILEHTFQFWGVKCTALESATEALNLLKSSTDFDVIIVDYNMPEMNGIEAIKKIKSEINFSNDRQTIILLHSSSDDIIIHKAAIELNINHTLTKPVKSKDLYYYLNNLEKDQNQNEINIKPLQNVQTTQALIDSPVKILIAEDTQMNMLVICNMLKNAIPNVIIFEATNGIDALDILKSEKADLILMDVQMPFMDGLETTDHIRKNKDSNIRKIPIIALTAGISKEERENCEKAGMNDFLSKPINKIALHEKLMKFINVEKPDDIIEMKENFEGSNLIHFNKAKLLKKIDNNSSLYLNLIELSMIEYPKYIENLNTALEGNNLKMIKSSAHSLKGSAYNLEFIHLGDLAHEVENNIDNPLKLKKIINNITQEWNQIKPML
ncbi:MAG: histidine kinase N-terminal 7TM domain-containing protein [Paludibacter sp.]|nr:histidine kinase N-terminal 7TM domain-containing protein [Paludibacter sp.]